jgi:diaminohydroxyphosphoribosylaminopyrimidine deaminase/5-amino-6-(5-phosphoribosylamino)uracil reductase
MAGIGTVLKDDPLLTCRFENGRDPIRILCDSHLRIPLESQICKTAEQVPTLVAATVSESGKKAELEKLGVRVLTVPERNGMVDLQGLMQRLGALEIDSILLEGGGRLNESALQAGLVREVYAYVAPKIFGGAAAKTPMEGPGVQLPKQAFLFSAPEVKVLENDLRLRYRARKDVK